ncbi:MAG: hypothetical protein ACO4AC_06825 [Pseudohongiellaceae bacterium]
MSEQTAGSNTLLEDCIEKIESAYEYMLAYAAQGRKNEPAETEGADSIRAFLKSLVWGISNIGTGFEESTKTLGLNETSAQEVENFKNILKRDAESALAVVALVLNVPSLSSQVIDNLNASTHVRSLLTDIFVMDEVLKIHQQHSAG